MRIAVLVMTSWLLLPLLACDHSFEKPFVAPNTVEGDRPGECEDANDNDGDGLYDCDDPDCAANTECLELQHDDDSTGDDDSAGG